MCFSNALVRISSLDLRAQVSTAGHSIPWTKRSASQQHTSGLVIGALRNACMQLCSVAKPETNLRSCSMDLLSGNIVGN